MRKVLLLTLIWLSSVPALAAGWLVDQATSAVTFNAVDTNGYLEIDGRGAHVTGGKDGVFAVQLAELTTGIDLRDHHMKEKYLQVDKYPTALLKIDGFPAASGKFTGTLTMHGVVKPVAGDVTLTPDGKRMAVVAKFGLKLGDFAIDTPSWLGTKVADNVTVNASFVADPQ